MDIVPDTKDWTWVLERPCPECGFDARSVSFDDIPNLVRDNAAGWSLVLQRADARTRPDQNTWSPLEYAAHVRDVCILFRERLALLLGEDDPVFADWDQDATALAERYGEQDPAIVAAELDDGADTVADAFATVPAEWRGRSGQRSDGSVFTVDTLARYFAHDIVHHLHDVTPSGP